MSLDPTQQQLRGGEGRTPSHDLGACVADLVNAVAKGMAELVAPHDLIPLEFALLRVVLGKEECTATQLAQVLPVKVSRISVVVTKMVGRGLMRRCRLPNDRRVVMLSLTEEGKALTLELHRRVQAYDARLCAGVSEEAMSVFASVTTEIMANYAALASSPTAVVENWPPSESSGHSMG